LSKVTWKYSGIHKGSTTASSKSLFASVRPATSSHLTPGEVSNTSLSSISANSGSGPSYILLFDFPSSPSPFYKSTNTIQNHKDKTTNASLMFFQTTQTVVRDKLIIRDGAVCQKLGHAKTSHKAHHSILFLGQKVN